MTIIVRNERNEFLLRQFLGVALCRGKACGVEAKKGRELVAYRVFIVS